MIPFFLGGASALMCSVKAVALRIQAENGFSAAHILTIWEWFSSSLTLYENRDDGSSLKAVKNWQWAFLDGYHHDSD